MPDFSIKFENQSTTPWSRYYWTAPSDAAFTINTSPNDTLKGGNGVEVLAWSQFGNTMGGGGTEDYADGQVVWKAPNGKCFGVRIHIPVQILSIGTSPYYQTKTSPDGDWGGENRNEPYNFDKTDLGFAITAKAEAGHESMQVVVTITDV